jgi:hypothetical protein
MRGTGCITLPEQAASFQSGDDKLSKAAVSN